MVITNKSAFESIHSSYKGQILISKSISLCCHSCIQYLLGTWLKPIILCIAWRYEARRELFTSSSKTLGAFKLFFKKIIFCYRRFNLVFHIFIFIYTHTHTHTLDCAYFLVKQTSRQVPWWWDVVIHNNSRTHSLLMIMMMWCGTCATPF